MQDTAVARFYTQAVQNHAKTMAEGRAIFDDVPMIEIRIPGDKYTIFHDQVFADLEQTQPNGAIPNGPASYIERFPRQWEAYRSKHEQTRHGMPLEQWPLMSASRIAELKAVNIWTVEEYASIPDGTLTKLGMHARKERDAARALLANTETNKAAAENAELKDKLAALEGQMASLLTALNKGSMPAAPAVAPEPEPEGKLLEDCTDEELKAYIKAKTGEAPRGTPSRETLLTRAAAAAATDAEAA